MHPSTVWTQRDDIVEGKQMHLAKCYREAALSIKAILNIYWNKIDMDLQQAAWITNAEDFKLRE